MNKTNELRSLNWQKTRRVFKEINQWRCEGEILWQAVKVSDAKNHTFFFVEKIKYSSKICLPRLNHYQLKQNNIFFCKKIHMGDDLFFVERKCLRGTAKRKSHKVQHNGVAYKKNVALCFDFSIQLHCIIRIVFFFFSICHVGFSWWFFVQSKFMLYLYSRYNYSKNPLIFQIWTIDIEYFNTTTTRTIILFSFHHPTK